MPTKLQMHQWIQSGRQAIERSLLSVLLRTHPLSPADDAELQELHLLIDLYNKWMAQYELPTVMDLDAANDHTSSDD